MDSPQPSPSSLKSRLSLSPERQASLSTAEQGSSPVLSPVLSGAGTARMDNQEEQKHKVGHSRDYVLLGPGLQTLRSSRVGRKRLLFHKPRILVISKIPV